MATKRVEIIGSGNVGSAFARGLRRVGHDVKTIGRDKVAMRATTAWADVVLLAVPFGALGEVVSNAGVQDSLQGKHMGQKGFGLGEIGNSFPEGRGSF